MIYLILITAFLLHLPLLIYFPKPPKITHQRYDVCIILGCPTQLDGRISHMQKSRMNKAIALYQTNRVSMLLISGSGVKNTFIEADVMSAYAQKNNVASTDIIVEKNAKNTYDNIRFAHQICAQRHLYSAIIVTSQFHTRRSNFFVRKFFKDYAICSDDEHEKWKHYAAEYIRMWNTLRVELILKLKK